MPWTAASANDFKKGLSKKQRKKWASVANGVLAGCMDEGGKDCEGKAVRIANSKFAEFNPVVTGADADKIMEKVRMKKFQFRKLTPPDAMDGHAHTASYDEDGNGATDVVDDHHHMVFNFKVQPYFYFDHDNREEYTSAHPGSLAFQENGGESCQWITTKSGNHICLGGAEEGHVTHAKEKNELARKTLVQIATTEKESGVAPYRIVDQKIKKQHVQEHEDAAKIFSDCGECEMEIFRPGTHNGDAFDEADLEEIAENFQKLKGEVRPKLKITHREKQESLAGLMSYGDVVEVFLKKMADGTRRLFAKIANVPKQILELIKERRFPERSIEIYPKFKLGTKDDSPEFRNVLKAVALLGYEMPAVTGMAPVKLKETLECQGTLCLKEMVEIIMADGADAIPECVCNNFTAFEAMLQTEKRISETISEGR